MKITFRIVFKCSENKWTYSYSFLWRILKENANPGNKKLIFNKDERCLNGKCKKWLRITVKTRYCTSWQIISKKHCRMFFIYQVFCAILFQRFLLKPCFLAITLFQLIRLYRKKKTPFHLVKWNNEAYWVKFSLANVTTPGLGFFP